MMATNRMIMDLADPNDHVVSLSLTTLAEISTDDMCRAMAIEVAKLMNNNNYSSYVRKKAILTAA
jgi:vesicle coat complex subunit